MAAQSQVNTLAAADLTAAAEVQQLVKQAESSTLEFKSKADVSATLQTICAFLNGEGGRIIIGIGGDGKIVGLPDVEAMRQKLLQRLQTQVAPPPNVTATVVELSDQQVILLEVAPGRDRPYIFNNAIYVRKGAANPRASPAEIVQLINGLDMIPRWEASLRTEMTLSDLDQRHLICHSRSSQPLALCRAARRQ